MRMNVASHSVAFLLAFVVMVAIPTAHAASASEYVQDGLLACWDGVENAGVDTHDASATVWKDLVAGCEFSLYNVTVADDSMVFAGTQSSYGELDAANTAATFGSATNGMLEIVYASTDGASSYTVLQSSSDSGIALGMYQSRFLAGSGNAANAPMFSYAAGLSTNSVTIRYSSARPVGAWVWGDVLGTTSSDSWGAADGKTTIGTRASKQNNAFKGAIYCIRVYSRQLTALEIAANSAVDRRRFVKRSGVYLDGISLNGFFRGAAIVVNNLADGVRLTNFPVLVRISSENFSGFSYRDMFASATGRDLAFTDAQGRGLAYDIDTWNTNGTSLVWVTVPVLTNGTKIAMFYRSGNDGKSICPGNAFSDYVGVWHMNETADGVTTVYDSTTNDLYGTSVASSLSKADGIVGRARYITDNETISANSKPVAPYDSGVTVDMTEDAAKLSLVDSIIPEFSASFWIRPQRSAPQFWYLISRRAADKGTGWAIQSMDGFGKFRLYGGKEDDQQCTQISGTGGFSNGAWVKVDAVWNDTTLRFYVNGALSRTATLKQSPTATLPNKLGLGGSPAPLSSSVYSGRGVKGDMDEIRLRAGSLSAEWIAASYAQEAADAFLSYGAVESFAESAAPIATFEVVDIDQTSARYTGNVGSPGAGATTVDILAKTWPVDGAEPQGWTTIASCLAAGDAFSYSVTGLSSETAYTNLFKAVNNMATPVESEVATIPFTTTSYCSIELDSVEATNATFSVTFTGFGAGASSVLPVLEVCASSDFATGVLPYAAASEMTELGTIYISATGLAVSSQYWARATATNSLGTVLTSAPVQFATHTPGTPVANASATAYGFNSYSAQVRVTAFGTYATDATAWLELSEDDSFASVDASSAPDDAPLSAYVAHTVSGLAADKTYHARFVVRNGLGVTTYVALPDVVTPVAPFVASGPGWTAGDGTFDFALDVSAVYGGAVCTATLSYGGVEVGSVEFDDLSDEVVWRGVAARADGSEARIVVETTLDGALYSQIFSVPVAAGSSGFAVSSAADYESAVGALRVRPGDSIVMPALRGPVSYEVLNPRFASVGGNVVKALEPGIVGVRCVDASYTTNVMGVIVLPTPIGNGGVYIFREKYYGSARNWSRSECWDKVGADVNTDCPTNADDIAIIPFCNQYSNETYLRTETDISLGGLYLGLLRDNASVNAFIIPQTSGEAKTITFARSDGKPVQIRVCCNSSRSDNNVTLCFGRTVNNLPYLLDVVWANDAEIDCCSSETAANSQRGFFIIASTTPPVTNTLQNVKLTVTGLPDQYINTSTCSAMFRGVWRGTGEIIKKGQGGIAFNGDFSGFSGTIREVTRQAISKIHSPAAGVLMRAVGATNVTAHVYGYSSSAASGSPTYGDQSFGKLASGGDASITPDLANNGPGGGLYMHGGVYRACKVDNNTWGVGVADEKKFDVVSVGAGWNYICAENGKGNESGYPINVVTAGRIEHSDRGTLSIYDGSCIADQNTSVTNSMFVVKDLNGYLTGAAGDLLAGDVYPIVPWLVVSRDDNFDNINFGAFDANGRIRRTYRNDTEIDGVASEDSNAYVYDGNLNNGSATDITVNSLFLNNSIKNKHLGADRTLRIKSGGLILAGYASAIGAEGRSDNGALVLGDASHPAYVFAKGNKQNTPNEIWASVTAPGGFVSAWNGNLILGGDQTGIAGELVVNAGSLTLGTQANECRLAKGLTIRVCAGASLSLPAANTLNKCALMFDGSGGEYGKVELSSDQTCSSISVRDVLDSQEWKTLKSGVYGSSESGAEFVRDDLFSGSGRLTVRRNPFVLVVR